MQFCVVYQERVVQSKSHKIPKHVPQPAWKYVRY